MPPVILAVVILLVIAAGLSTPRVIPACSGLNADEGDCRIREVHAFDIFSPQSMGAGFDYDRETPSVEAILEKGLDELGLSPTHIAVRGTAQSDSVRCEWHGVACTSEQREAAIRFWLGIGEDEVLPSPDEIEERFMFYVDQMSPRHRLTWAANVSGLARGGLNTDTLFLACYATYEADDYLLGSGPSTIALGYDQLGESPSYDLYSRAHAAGDFRDEPLKDQGEYQADRDEVVWATETSLGEILAGHETVVFLAPMGSHGNVTVELWQVVAQWDLQIAEDNTVHAVRFGSEEDDPEHTQTLANLVSRIEKAASTDAFAGDRIDNIDGLDDHYRDIGAYGDITPEDGSTATFTPVQPPPAPTCAMGGSVVSPNDNRALVQDCEVLLKIMKPLAGGADLDWTADSPISGWEGVTIAGTPSRATQLRLARKGLNGTIPINMGTLSGLTNLDLRSNDLTGDIPAELGWLFNLEEIRLSGNGFTGCIPVALEGVSINDLGSLDLLYCSPPAPEGLSAGTLGESSVELSWFLISNVSWYRLEFRVFGDSEWIIDNPAIVDHYHAVIDIGCGASYQFRVSAFGTGERYQLREGSSESAPGYAGAWSEPSEVVSAATAACAPPIFDAKSYGFSLPVDAALGTVVGIVNATDSADDTVTYAITAGNADGLFAINESTGRITLAGAIDGTDQENVTLTVEAKDGNGNAASMEVTIKITVVDYTALCSYGLVIPNPSMFPELVRDCAALLSILNTLAGTGSLDWSANIPIENWEGIELSLQENGRRWVSGLALTDEELTGMVPAEIGQMVRLESLILNGNQLTGHVPSELGQLTQLEFLDLSRNQLIGNIPAEFGGLTSIRTLNLSQNQIDGEIPPILGQLSSLEVLGLNANQLGGPIPPELGDLTNLEQLWLSDNLLTGEIPESIGDLPRLTKLRIGNNPLGGCVPGTLRDLADSDHGSLNLPYCDDLAPAPQNLSVSAAGGTSAHLLWDPLDGAERYRVEHRLHDAEEWTTDDDTVALSSYTVDDLTCETSYDFRVSAYGNGTDYAAEWGAASAAVSTTTGECNRPPQFALKDYTFVVVEGATTVGTVSAMDPDTGDGVSFPITAGNTEGIFAIDLTTGIIEAAAPIGSETPSLTTLTVQAEDGRGATDEAVVAIYVARPPSSLTVIPTGDYRFSVDWTVRSGESAYRLRYREKGAAEHQSIELATNSYVLDSGQVCDRLYQFSVSSQVQGVWSPYHDPAMEATCNEAPEFGQDNYSYTVGEDAATGYVLGSPSATDAEGNDPEYSLTAGNDMGHFAVNSSTGEITVLGTLDYAMTSMYTLTMEAEDGMGGRATTTVNIAVEEVIATPPAPLNLAATASGRDSVDLTWDTVPGADRYRVEQRIGDSGEWTIVDEDVVNANYVASGLSCDTRYDHRVSARGDGTTYETGWGPPSTITETVTGKCNQDPEFTPDTYNFSIGEDAATGDSVGTVTASDGDGDNVTYSIIGGNESGSFTIGQDSGVIEVLTSLDYETLYSYILVVEASDGEGGRAEGTANVKVTDVAESPPPAPLDLTATSGTDSVTLNWGAPDDSSITGYQILRKKLEDEDMQVYVEHSNSLDTNYVDTAVEPGTTYVYRVRAINPVGVGDGSNDAQVQTKR